MNFRKSFDYESASHSSNVSLRLAHWLLLPTLIALALLFAFRAEAQVIYPNRGGTGTTTAPAYGQVLVGNAQGTYTPTATSALGVTHDPVSLSGALDYLTIVGQNIVRGFIDLATDITGLLGAANGGTGTSSPSQFLYGTGNSIVSTSTISQNYIDAAIARVSSLASYLTLSSWYATTTDALSEGSTNRYFTDSRADARARSVINASTSIPQEPGQDFGNLLRWSGSRWIAVATSTLGIFWSDVRNVPAGFADGVDDAFSTTSADYWDATKWRWATSSSDYWLGTKSTSNLTEGSNLYYTLSRFASALAGTTTDALSEGATNRYYTDARVGAYVSGSSTIPHTGGSAWGDLLRWTGSAWASFATSTLGIAWSDLRGVPAGFADGIDDTGNPSDRWATSTDLTSIYPNTATKVGIGTSTPTGILTVGGSSPLLAVSSTNNNVGIGKENTSASALLDINGSMRAGCATSGVCNGLAYIIGDDAALSDINVANTVGIGSAGGTGSGGIRFGAGGAPVVTGTTGGYLGISTTTPGALLTVGGNTFLGGNVSATGSLTVSGTADPLAAFYRTSSDASIRIGRDASNYVRLRAGDTNANDLYIDHTADSHILYWSGNSFRFIAPAATSGATTQSPTNFQFYGRYWNGSASLDVPSQITSTVVDTTPTVRLGLRVGSGNVSSEYLSILSNGLVGIATTSPYAALSVVGSTGVVAEKYNATGTATSTFAWDINIASGHCIQYNGSCISLGGGGVSGGTANMLAAFTSATAVTATGTPAVTAINATSSSATSTFAGSISLVGFGYFGSSSVATLNNVIYADRMPGADIGAKINNAYAFLSSYGGTIVVPAGFYSFSTQISMQTLGKRALIQCTGVASSTTLYYTGSGTSTIINWGGGNVLGQDHEFGAGIDGCTFRGNDANFDTSVGIQIGGTQGGEGVRITHSRVTNFSKGLTIGNNTWLTHVEASEFDGSQRNLVWEADTNAGESLNFVDTVFHDSWSASTTNHYYQCVDLSKGNLASFTMSGGALDDCQLYVGAAATVSLFGTHIENPASDGTGNQYIPIYVAASQYTSLNLQSVTWVQGASTEKPPYFLYNGGNTTITGFQGRNSGGGMVDFLVHNDNSDGGGSLHIDGTNNFGGEAYAAITDVDPSGFDVVSDGNWYTHTYIQTQNSFPYIQQMTNYNTMLFYNSNKNIMTFGFDGNVGIGTTTPAASLEVSTPALTNATLYLTQIGYAYLHVKAQDAQVRITFNKPLYFDSDEGGTTRFAIGTSSHFSYGFDDTTSVGTCGTSPTITGNDANGTVTMGAGSVAACTVTFKVAYASVPRCFMNLKPKDSNATATVTVVIPAAGSFTIKASASNLGGSAFDYFCTASSTPSNLF